MAATWSAIGLMAAISVAFFYFLYARLEGLGAKIDEHGRSLGARIDALGAELRADLGGRIDALGARIDAQGADLGRRIEAQSARIDALSARLDVHIAGHRSTG
ncbi:MAG: hypothetical protein HYU54_09535 [Actinobacteria bacterium]|nr:hypothetical protein [Actinomycetota bacterium]